MNNIRAYLINTDQVQDTVVFAENVSEAESKLDGSATRLKVLDWIPIRSKTPDVDGKWFLVEFKSIRKANAGASVILLLKAGTLSEAESIGAEEVSSSSYKIQGIESLDLTVIE